MPSTSQFLLQIYGIDRSRKIVQLIDTKLSLGTKLKRIKVKRYETQ